MEITLLAYIIYFFFYLLSYGLMEFSYFKFSLPKWKRLASQIQSKEITAFKPVWPYGAMAYASYVFAFWYYVLHDIVAGHEKRWYMILFNSTLMALAIYGTFNLTNYVMLERYSQKIVIRDILWGIFVLNATAFILFFLKRYFDCRCDPKNKEK